MTVTNMPIERVLYVVDSVFTYKDDQGPLGRRNQIAQKLLALMDGAIKVKDISPRTNVTEDSGVVAIFVHLTDVVEKDYKELCIFLSKTAAPIVAYSGGGASSETSIKEQLQTKGIENHENWFLIQSKLDTPKDFEDSEWRSLVDWLLNPGRPTDRDSLPSMISPARSIEYGLSLSLLCQGFLAQYALKPANCGNGAIKTNGCADVGTALKAMGWVNEDGSKPEIVNELERQRSTEAVDESESERDEANSDKSSKSNSELDFWRSPFEGKSLRQGLEEECRSLRKNVQNKIQNGTLEWPDNATLPCRTAKLVEAIEKAIETKETLSEGANNNKLFDEDFTCVVAQAYLDLNLLLEAV
jgi:hypothetical protein